MFNYRRQKIAIDTEETIRRQDDRFMTDLQHKLANQLTVRRVGCQSATVDFVDQASDVVGL